MDFKSIILLFLKIEMLAAVIKTALLFKKHKGKELNKQLIILEKIIDIIIFPFQKIADWAFDFAEMSKKNKTIEAFIFFGVSFLTLVIGLEKLFVITIMIGTFIGFFINFIHCLYLLKKKRNQSMKGKTI